MKKERFAILVALFGAFIATCHGELRTLTVDFEFRQQRNPGYFGLELPIPGHLFVQYDDAAFEYWETVFDPSIGVYKTPGAYGGLSFGTGIGFHYIPFTDTEVRVWNGYQGVTDGVSFGNAKALSAYGLIIGEYRIYAFFPNIFWPVAGWDDRLHRVADTAGDWRFEYLSYVFIDGYASPWTETLLQTSGPQHYTVQ